MLFYNKERLKQKAERSVAQGSLLKAAGHYRQIIKQEPEERDVLCMLGEVLIKLGKKAEGLDCLKKAARIFNQQNENLKAMSIWKKYLQHAGQDLDAISALAELYLQVNNPQEAAGCWVKASHICEKENTSGAIFYLEKAMKIDPENLDTLVALAELYSREKMTQRAQEYHFRAGKKLFERGDFARSYFHLYAVIQSEPDNRDANLMILDTLMKLKSYSDALIHLNGMGWANADRDDRLLSYRAEILLQLDRIDELKALLHKMSMLSRDGSRIIFEHAGKLKEMGRLARAVEVLELFDMSQFPSIGGRLQQLLQEILAEDENNSGALQKLIEYKVFMGDVHGVKSLYSRLYSLLLKTGDIQKGAQVLEKWLNLDEENDWIRQEMRRLKLLIEEKSQQKVELIRGKIEEIGLADVIQMLESARKTGALQIRFADLTGWIYFTQGNMIHASFKEVIGEDAIILLLKLTGGDFTFDPALPPNVIRTITGTNTQVVLDALRIIDEETQRIEET